MAGVGRDEWGERVERWRDSGLSAREYGQETGVSASSLAYWKWRLKKEAAGAEPALRSSKRPHRRAGKSVSFVEFPAPSEGPPHPSTDRRIELAIGSRYTIRLPEGFDAAALRRLL